MFVGGAFRAAHKANDDGAVFQRDFLNRQRSTTARALGRFGHGSAERGIIPLPVLIVQQRDLGILDRDAGNVYRLRKNKRHHFHANVYFFGGYKRRLAEFRIFADHQVFRPKRSAQKRQAQIPDLHLSAQGSRSLLFNRSLELIHRN